MKLCIDCKHYQPERIDKRERCGKQPSPVSGQAREDWRGNPRLQRGNGLILSVFMRACGLRAAWFDPRCK